MDDIHERVLHLNRLLAWKEELETNKHGMQYIAERTIGLIQEEIKRKWPLEEDTDNKPLDPESQEA